MAKQSSHSGLELDVATLLAKELGRPLEVKWIAQRDHSYFRQTIGAGQCDAIMSVPSGMGRLTTTKPWYHTGFYFVTRKEDNVAPQSFDDESLKKLTIGVPATGLGETPPAIALTHRGLTANLHPYSIYEPEKMIAAVANKEVDMAIAWGPFAGWFAGERKTSLSIQPAPEQDGQTPLAFDMSIGVKKGNDALKDQLNAALDKQHDAITALLKKWRVPVKEA